MLRKLSTLILSCALVAVANSAAQGQHGRDMQADHARDGRGDYGENWTLLGERHIDGRADNDKIDMAGTTESSGRSSFAWKAARCCSTTSASNI